MNENTIIDKISKMLSVPGGRRATGVILEKLGALPFIEEVLDNDYLVDKQNKLNAGLQEWISQTYPNLEIAFQTIEDELNLPTKENFSFLFGETLEIQLPFLIQEGMMPCISVILNASTIQEFTIYEKIGFIDIITDKSDVRLNALIPNKKIFSDMKRPLAADIECVIQLKDSLYK